LIGDNIRLYRIKKGLTQEALALEIGITQVKDWSKLREETGGETDAEHSQKGDG